MLWGAQGFNTRNNAIAETVVQGMSGVTGRDTQIVGSFTGRIPLWNDILTLTADEPFGTGFAAGERTFSALREQQEGNWGAMSAHNGYLSAWVGTGWPGVILVALVYFAAFRRARDMRRNQYGLLLACIVVVDAINNLTFPGVGSTLGIPWIAIFSVLGASGVQAPGLQRQSAAVQFESPPNNWALSPSTRRAIIPE